MKAAIISIGNSRGIRIPKALIRESGIENYVEIKLMPDGLYLKRIREVAPAASEARLSEMTLGRDWNRADEDAAWANL